MRARLRSQVPWLGPCSRLAVLLAPVAATTSIVWAVYRNEAWSWVLQDVQVRQLSTWLCVSLTDQRPLMVVKRPPQQQCASCPLARQGEACCLRVRPHVRSAVPAVRLRH